MRWPTKSRSMRRVKRKTPGNRVVIHLKPRKHGRAVCARCKTILHGVKEYGSKSQKKPTRAYGGYFCSACTREYIIGKNRVQ